MRTIQHWISGSETTGASTRWGPVWNPATGEQQAQVALAEPADVDAAVAAAAKAWQEWRDVSVIRRARVMFALRDLIERHLDEISVLVADEHGKVVSDAKGEVIRGLEVVEYACGIPTLAQGRVLRAGLHRRGRYSFRQPLGVCAGITPFNFPAMVPMWMHPVAIAAGNTFILKPSERDPSASNFSPAVRRRRAARGRLQRGARGQGGGGRDPGPPRHRGGVVRRLDADRQVRAPAGFRGW
jgi:NAD-dependent aldehyde dehydrogenases